MKCQDCGLRRKIVAYERCRECMTFLDTCAECGDDLHLHFPDNNRDHRFEAQQREGGQR